MRRQSTSKTSEIGPRPQRRRYDSTLRREQMAQTRERILTAGSELAHRAKKWDWRDLTIEAIARQAGVSERTIYRHFPTERQLHESLMRRLEHEAGVSYETLAADDLAEATARLFASLPSFAAPLAPISRDPTFAASNERRREALTRAVAELAQSWPATDRRVVAGLLDVLWSPLSYERLTNNWGLDTRDATRAVTWIIELLVQSMRDGARPQPRSGKRRVVK
jgi:AcrR family transcriptional regulator